MRGNKLIRRSGAVITLALVAVLLAAACDNDEDAVVACDAALPDAALVLVFEPASGAEVSRGFEASGCSRTFEGTVTWRLLDRSGQTLAQGFTMGGAVDGPGSFSFTVQYESAERQFGHLEVFEEDVSGGEGFPPPRDVVPLVLEPAP